MPDTSSDQHAESVRDAWDCNCPGNTPHQHLNWSPGVPPEEIQRKAVDQFMDDVKATHAADTVRTWTTYRLADGDLICGEYSWVDGPEFFEDLDEPLDVVKQTWVLQAEETVTFKPFGWDDDEAEQSDGGAGDADA